MCAFSFSKCLKRESTRNTISSCKQATNNDDNMIKKTLYSHRGPFWILQGKFLDKLLCFVLKLPPAIA